MVNDSVTLMTSSLGDFSASETQMVIINSSATYEMTLLSYEKNITSAEYNFYNILSSIFAYNTVLSPSDLLLERNLMSAQKIPT